MQKDKEKAIKIYEYGELGVKRKKKGHIAGCLEKFAKGWSKTKLIKRSDTMLY